MRSFRLPVGFSHSSLTRICAQPGGTTLRRRTSDVLPTASRTDVTGAGALLLRRVAHGQHFPLLPVGLVPVNDAAAVPRVFEMNRHRAFPCDGGCQSSPRS